ncbi:MAG: ribonuclease D [Idiomarina sp.]|nr:MAG: ribonuclease D [Idiomarina sp.]
MLPFQLITTNADLLAFCEQARQAPYLALDTEFVRTRTYYAHLGLLQVRAAEQLVLIDPTSGVDLEPFWQLLKDPNVHVVIHAGGEDYEILAQNMGQIPTHIFDTQIGAAFAGHGEAMGYAAMVKHYDDVELDKSQSRTDWLQRPLSVEQLDYAAADVFYLHDIYPRLRAELSDEKIALVEAESAEQVIRRAQQVPPQWLYLFFGNAWQCNQQQLAVLRELMAWRLERAKKSDIPLGFVAKDHTLLELARRMPENLGHLRGITDLSPVTIRYAGDSLLAAIRKGQAADSLPEPLERLTDMRGYKPVFNAIKQAVAALAKELGVEPGLIASRRLINDVIHWEWQIPAAAKSDLSFPDLYRSWRGAKLKASLEAILQRDR